MKRERAAAVAVIDELHPDGVRRPRIVVVTRSGRLLERVGNQRLGEWGEIELPIARTVSDKPQRTLAPAPNLRSPRSPGRRSKR